jgi:hypothetical protein
MALWRLYYELATNTDGSDIIHIQSHVSRINQMT